MKKAKSNTSWFKLLQLELSMAEPEECHIRLDVMPGENVLGVASDESQRLFAHGLKLEEQSTRALVDAHYEHDKERREALYRQGVEMRSKASFLDHLLLMQLREEFGVWNPDTQLGMRKGFVVVSTSGRNPISDIINRLGDHEG